MKVKDFCKQYNFNVNHFENYVKTHNIRHKDSFSGMMIDDEDIPQILAAYRNEIARLQQEAQAKKAAEEQAKIDALNEEQRKKKILSEMLITSGFNFDGYTIKKYSGYISGDDCVTIPRNNFFGTSSVDKNLCGALVKIRRQAIKELKEAAYNLGCNAVIGVDFDYLTIDPQHAATLNAQITVYEPYVICVTANGNAVVIEKDEIATSLPSQPEIISTVQSKYCPSCGNEVNNGDIFCSNCGTKIHH